MSAPEFTPEEAAKVAEFDAAPTPPEVLREQVATVLASHEPHYHTETESFTCSPDGTDPAARAGCLWRSDPDLTDEETARAFRLHVADAALAVFRGQQDPAVSPREHVWSEWVEDPSGFCMDPSCLDGEIR